MTTDGDSNNAKKGRGNAGRPPFRARIGAWFIRERGPAFRFALFYMVAIAAAVAGDLQLGGHAFGHRALTLLAVFTAGALAAGFSAWLLASLVAGQRPAAARFSAMTASLIVATAGFSALFYFFEFYSYFAAYHDPFYTPRGVAQILITGASAGFQFVASGLRYLVPLGLPILFAGAAYFAARTRPAR